MLVYLAIAGLTALAVGLTLAFERRASRRRLAAYARGECPLWDVVRRDLDPYTGRGRPLTRPEYRELQARLRRTPLLAGLVPHLGQDTRGTIRTGGLKRLRWAQAVLESTTGDRAAGTARPRAPAQWARQAPAAAVVRPPRGARD